jgi:hypothetical protein
MIIVGALWSSTPQAATAAPASSTLSSSAPPRLKDQINIRLVQVKAGTAALPSPVFGRLCSAVKQVSVEALAALCDGATVHAEKVARSAGRAVSRPPSLRSAVGAGRPVGRAEFGLPSATAACAQPTSREARMPGSSARTVAGMS